MPEYIEREAAIYEIEHDLPGVDSYCRVDAVYCIRFMDAADVVEVVRCRDCKSYRNTSPHTGARFDFYFCSLVCTARKPDDFCSRGERRMEDG